MTSDAHGETGAGGLHVEIDPDLCVGNAECVRVAPQVFEVDEVEGVARTRPQPWEVSAAALEDAEAACPSQAITIRRSAP